MSLDRKPTSSTVIDTLERVLDRCVVIVAIAADSVVAFNLSHAKARVVVLLIEVREWHASTEGAKEGSLGGARRKDVR